MLKFLPAEDISAEDAANDVAQVGDVVDVRQGAGHKQVSLALLWQTDRKKTELLLICLSHNSSTDDILTVKLLHTEAQLTLHTSAVGFGCLS